MKVLLTLVLVFSSACFGSGPPGAGNDKPKLKLEHPVNPHLDIPHNCQKTIETDDSVLLTCECEACGLPDERDGQDPVPWVCNPRDGGLYCSYDIDTQTSGERKHSRI